MDNRLHNEMRIKEIIEALSENNHFAYEVLMNILNFTSDREIFFKLDRLGIRGLGLYDLYVNSCNNDYSMFISLINAIDMVEESTSIRR